MGSEMTDTRPAVAYTNRSNQLSRDINGRLSITPRLTAMSGYNSCTL